MARFIIMNLKKLQRIFTNIFSKCIVSTSANDNSNTKGNDFGGSFLRKLYTNFFEKFFDSSKCWSFEVLIDHPHASFRS